MCRDHRWFLFILLLLLAIALHPFVTAHGQEAPGTFLVVPEPDEEILAAPPDPGPVAEVLRLPSAETAAPAALEALREQEVVPGVPIRDGFRRSAPARRVVVRTAPPAWAGARTGELRRPDGAAASWLGRFVVEGAHAFRVRLREVELPPASRIWIHADGVRLGPYGHELVTPDGELWLPPAPGPEVVVEIELPPEGAKSTGTSDLRFTLGDVMEVVAAPQEGTLEPEVWSDCDVDAICVDLVDLPIIDQLRESAARLSFVVGSSSFLCSGGLISDVDPGTERPFLLTANHCFDTQASASSLVAYFDYRPSSCGGGSPPLSWVPNVAGATLLATDPVSDFTFVELSANPSGTNWYLGWTTTDPVFGTDMHRVSHPAGLTQRYSASSFTGDAGIVCGGLPTSDFHYSAQTEGSTAGGSSGAPVAIDDNGDARVVGQLLGACHFIPWDDCDYSSYNTVDGAFSTTYPFIAQWIDQPPACADDYEPDDDAGTASPLDDGSAQFHRICPVGDEDWALVTVASESAVTLETSGPSGDTRMWLYDSGLSLVEFDDDDGSGLFSRIDRTCGVDALPAGIYYVQVDEFGDNDEIAGYDLSYDVTEACGGSCPDHLLLANTTISGTVTYRAGDTITLGPSLVVDGTSVDVIAGQKIVLGDGTRIGGTFSAVTDPAACSP